MKKSDEIAQEMARLLKEAGTHTIVQNDNYWNLAKKYNMTADDIKAANPSVDPAKLHLNQKIIIPTAEQLDKIRKSRELPKSQKGNIQEQIDAAITSAANSNSISEDILRGLIFTESRGDICAKSAKGAIGLCQVMPYAAQSVGASSVMDPVQNVHAGAKWLSKLYDEARKLSEQYPSEYNLDTLALMLYNAGGPRITNALSGKSPLPNAILEYPKNVLNNKGKKMVFFCSSGDV